MVLTFTSYTSYDFQGTSQKKPEKKPAGQENKVRDRAHREIKNCRCTALTLLKLLKL